MKSIPTYILILLFSLLVATVVGWRVAEYSMLSSRSDAFMVIGVVFSALAGLLSLIYFVLRRRGTAIEKHNGLTTTDSSLQSSSRSTILSLFS